MALSTHALTTVAQVESVLGWTSGENDVLAHRLINVISEVAEEYCDRHFEYNAAIQEDLDGYGDAFLFVKRPPLLAITSILRLDVAGSTIETYSSSDYRIDGDGLSGGIYKPTLWPSTSEVDAQQIDMSRLVGQEARLIRVTYGGGYVTPQDVLDDNTVTRTLPYSIEGAVLQSIQSLYQTEAKKDPTIISKTSGEVSTTWRNPNIIIGTGPHMLTAEARAVLDTYRIVRF